MEIIPAIDIIDGKCVRLTKGDYTKVKIYREYPVEVAKQFEDAGVQRLHLVDLDGARTGSVVNMKVLEQIAGKTSLSIDFSGGISNNSHVKDAFDSGAAMISVGSIAIKNKGLLLEWIASFGSHRFILGADVKDGLIMIKGWTENTNVDIDTFITSWISEGINSIFCTDISKDGMMEGPSLKLYKSLIENHPSINLIASGGVTTTADITSLQQAGCSGVIIGKALYEGTILLHDLKQYAIEHGTK